MTLRVAVLLDRDYYFAWEAEMLRRVSESTTAVFSLMIMTEPDETSRGSGFWPKLYSRLDRRLFRGAPDAFRKIGVSEVSPGTTRMSVGRSVPDSAVASKIRDARLDVIVDLTENGMQDRFCDFARFGVWRHRVGIPSAKGIEPGFLELAGKIPTLQASLEMVRARGEEINVLCRSFSRMDHLSLIRSRNIAAWRCASFVFRELEKLTRTGEQEYLKRVAPQNVPPFIAGLQAHSSPTALSSFVAVVRQLLCIPARAMYKVLFVEQWILAYSFGEAMAMPSQPFRRIIPGKDRFWADPHIVSRNGEWYIFFEELPYSTGKGHISVVRLDEGGNVSQPVKILEKPHHLSNPFVFSWEGVYYMIPETSQNRTIELYKCKHFPDEWEPAKILMKNVRAVDATVFFHQSKWWMFTNIAQCDGSETLDELFLFYADDFRTESWTPHPMNPVVSDIRNARPAGRVFEHKGFLVRPAQDCSNGYGGATNLNRIVRLNEREYEEVLIQSVKPSWGENLIGLHTVSVDPRLTVIDLCVKRWRFGL